MACILVVDDDADGSEAVARFLERAGHRVVHAVNGRRALAALALARPDVIVLDLLMPDLDGIGFLKVMRGYFGPATVPVLVLTAIPDGDVARRAAELGAKRVFRKADFQLAELLDSVNECVPVKPRRHGDTEANSSNLLTTKARRHEE